ncbi:MAG: ATP-binding cassette domain-containing protein [Verrucomicrobiota bacterium]|nr:ATP-binding cassette domain-containing protein [Verrucomicrobiota bacterium]
MSAIVANNLGKTYKTYKKKPGFWGAIKGLVSREYQSTHAAQGVSFTIEEGELVGFLGPNGAGKTTTLKMLSGLIHPTSGEATVLGFIPSERDNRFKKQFALVMGQKNALWWDLPAQESLELTAVIYEIEQESFRKRLDELTGLLDVRHKLNVMVRELSLGERMKFELINALIYNPKVLLLDEPTIGLDVNAQKTVREFLKGYNHENKITTILTSHYMQDIEELCERVMIIDHGHLVYNGRLDSILAQFSDHKIVNIECRTQIVPMDFSLMGEVLELKAQSLKIRVKRSRITTVCRDLLALEGVDDINIEEVPVEDIIREVFNQNKPVA